MIFVHGLGHFHPENVIDNAFLESLDIGTTDSWIMDRVGIRARRTVLSLDYIRDTRNRDPRGAHEASLYTNAETGARAAHHARGAAILWGDGTSGAIVTSPITSKIRIEHTRFNADPEGWKQVFSPAGGHFRQEGSAVHSFAVRRSCSLVEDFCTEYGKKPTD